MIDYLEIFYSLIQLEIEEDVKRDTSFLLKNIIITKIEGNRAYFHGVEVGCRFIIDDNLIITHPK